MNSTKIIQVLSKVCFIKTDTLYTGGTYIKCVRFYETDFMIETNPPQPQMVGFCNLVGVAIAPISKKNLLLSTYDGKRNLETIALQYLLFHYHVKFGI